MGQLSIKEQLFHLKNLTLRFGSLHEAQILQLRNYPLLIQGVDKAKATVDAEKHLVLYECESIKKFINTKKNKAMYDNIAKWIRTIVWDDTIVTINVNGRSVYDTRD